MSRTTRQQLVLLHLGGNDMVIGRALWMIEDTRRRTRRMLDGIQPAIIDWPPPHGGNSIGTLLFHIAAIEMDWLYGEVMEGNMPDDVWKDFPYPVRDADGRLTVVTGLSLDEHNARLDRTRKLLLDAYKGISLAEFRRIRRLEEYDVTPEWVLHHLMQHEAEHRGEMATTRTLAEKTLSTNP